MRRLFFAMIGLAVLLCGAASAAASGYLWPLRGVAKKVTSVFADARSDHPHAGFDLSLFGRVGRVPVVSVAEGALLRIRDSKFGYGRVVYIKMADDRVAVYAHLDRFSPRLQQLANEIRQRTGLQRLDYYWEEWEPPIRIGRGEIIGYGGRTGTSAPHLHFEMRREEHVNLNPLTNGFAVADRAPPRVDALLFAPLDGDARVNGSAEAQVVTCRAGERRVDVPPVSVAGRVGLAIDACDRHRPNGPTFSPYRLEVVIDGRVFFRVVYESWSWRDERLRLIQYDVTPSPRRLFLRAYNPFPVAIPFFSDADAGTFERLPPGEHRLTVVAADAAGHTDSVEMTLIVDKPGRPLRPLWPIGDGDQALFNAQSVTSGDKRFGLETGAESLFAPVRVRLTRLAADTVPGAHACYQTGLPTLPTRQPFGVRFSIAGAIQPLDKLGVYRLTENGPDWLGATSDAANESIRADTLEFGAFCLIADDEPPRVEAVHVARRQPVLTFEVRDNLAGFAPDSVRVWQGDTLLSVDFHSRSGNAAVRLHDRQREVTIVVFDRQGNATRVSVAPESAR
jgi:hypothetical protein